jgi:hypothetical protein
MNKSLFRIVVPLLLLGVIIGPSSRAFAEEKKGAVLNVKVRQAVLRSEPKAWASSVATVSYGDKLVSVGESEGWIKVQSSGGKIGYIHPSALTSKKVVLSGKGVNDSSTDKSQIVMAGKGFSKEVEKEYAASNASLNFQAVNEMEKLKVHPGELATFIKSGALGEKQAG